MRRKTNTEDTETTEKLEDRGRLRVGKLEDQGGYVGGAGAAGGLDAFEEFF